MCTVVIEVPESAADAVRLLAIRDEDPSRAWDAPGAWWAERPQTVGVRDRRAGGAWLAARGAAGRLAVILNRAEAAGAATDAMRGAAAHDTTSTGLKSRGVIVLNEVAGEVVGDNPGTAAFNLVSVASGRAVVTSWNGESLVRHDLEPGVHMIAHHDIDDFRSARIEAWLGDFRALTGAGDDWRQQWIALLDRTAQLPPSDDRAIIRDNTLHGYPTLSLLACTAEVSGAGAGASVRLESAVLDTPAVWARPSFRRAIL